MEVKIIEEKKNRIVLEIEGVGHGFCNALVKELYNDKDTKSAGYHIDHPLVGVPKFLIETKGIEPRDALKKALSSIKKQATEFKKEVAKL